MSDFLRDIPVTIPEPNPDEYKNKIKMLLTDRGGKWYINNRNTKSYPIKRSRKSKEAKKGKII